MMPSPGVEISTDRMYESFAVSCAALSRIASKRAFGETAVPYPAISLLHGPTRGLIQMTLQQPGRFLHITREEEEKLPLRHLPRHRWDHDPFGKNHLASDDKPERLGLFRHDHLTRRMNFAPKLMRRRVGRRVEKATIPPIPHLLYRMPHVLHQIPGQLEDPFRIRAPAPMFPHRQGHF